VKVLYFDCFSGISGDMTLGALLDLGLDQQSFLQQLSKLGLNNEYDIEIKKNTKNGITGLDVNVILKGNANSENHRHTDQPHEHAEESRGGIYQHHHDHSHHGGHSHHDSRHHHHHGSHHHSHNGSGIQRDFSKIKELIESSDLSANVKEIALKIFEKLARAEGKIHNVPYERVHFHEVGAVDSIVDIVGTAICIDMLKPDVIMASPVHLGGGFIKCQHGIFPVPAPATLELLKGIPVYSRGFQGELVTPTGAAILSALCSEFADFPPMVVEKVGYGLGKRNYEIPNCLRVCMGESLKK
jgi:uncharacterized protein (DUF111 family)